MKTIDFLTPEAQHVPDLGRICFDAFTQIHDLHGFPRDFPDVETATKVIGLLTSLPEAFGVAARSDGQLVGSNFMLVADSVGGVGPITVDPAFQGQGLGRRLMQAAFAHAAARDIERVRLLQDSFNTASLSLYASLGFDVREPVGVMRAPAEEGADPEIRLATAADIPAMAALCQQVYKVSRKRELTTWDRKAMPILVRESGGRIRGYSIPGMLGHGVAESDADAIALIHQISRHALPGMDVFFLPLRQAALYRSALHAGCRLIKVMTLMTRGPYETPEGTWMPSILF